MGTKRFLVTEEEKKNIISLYNYKGILQEQKNLMNEGDIDWGTVGKHTAIGAGTGALLAGSFTVPGALIGAAYSIVVQSLFNLTPSRNASLKLISACKTKGMGKPQVPDSTLKGIAKNIRNSIEYNAAQDSTFGTTGTNEELLRRSLNMVPTIPDLCSLNKLYSQLYPGTTLFDDIDGDIDDDEEWRKYVWEPIIQAYRNSVKINERNFKKEQQKKKQKLVKNAKECGYFSDEDYRKANWKCPSQVLINAKKCGWKTIDEYKLQDWACPGATPQEKEIIKKETQRIIYRDRDQGGGGMKYRDCTETYVKGCKSETIRKVQGCLGIGADGKMGNKTVSAVSAKIGRSYFTDGDVDKLCGGATNQEKKKSEFDDEIPTSDNQEPKKDVNTSSDFGGEEY